MAEYYLTVPLKDEDIAKLAIGDLVYFSGAAWTCRSRLQKHVFDEGHELPFSTKDKNLLIHVGPVVVQENGNWKLVSFMPTSSIRFEKWGAQSIETFGLKAIVGKTTMGNKSGLGSIEAAWQLELDALGPFLVDMDTKGRNHFDNLDKVIDENRRKVYKKLGIPEDFEYTKLY